jgi:hypothetical protein
MWIARYWDSVKTSLQNCPYSHPFDAKMRVGRRADRVAELRIGSLAEASAQVIRATDNTTAATGRFLLLLGDHLRSAPWRHHPGVRGRAREPAATSTIGAIDLVAFILTAHARRRIAARAIDVTRHRRVPDAGGPPRARRGSVFCRAWHAARQISGLRRSRRYEIPAFAKESRALGSFDPWFEFCDSARDAGGRFPAAPPFCRKPLPRGQSLL